jgi:hypothetical protein
MCPFLDRRKYDFYPDEYNESPKIAIYAKPSLLKYRKTFSRQVRQQQQRQARNRRLQVCFAYAFPLTQLNIYIGSLSIGITMLPAKTEPMWNLNRFFKEPQIWEPLLL